MLVNRRPSPQDGRATDAVLTDAGRTALATATPGPRPPDVLDGPDESLVPALRTALEKIHEQVRRYGTLPVPEQQHRLPGLTTGADR